MEVLESITLGVIQGITEWLPISSEGFIILAKNNLFGGGEFFSLVHYALFLHLGTLLAAVLYFRKDVWNLVRTAFNYKNSSENNRYLLKFILWVTIITGFLGLGLNTIADALEERVISSNFVNILVGAMLIITGLLQLRARSRGEEGLVLRDHTNATWKDKIIIGVGQGFAAIPGISRSGITIGLMLLQRFKEESALRLSFLLSIPAVLGANIVLNISENFIITPSLVVGAIVAAIVGYIFIDLFLKIAKRVNFGKFVIGFGILTLLATLI